MRNIFNVMRDNVDVRRDIKVVMRQIFNVSSHNVNVMGDIDDVFKNIFDAARDNIDVATEYLHLTPDNRRYRSNNSIGGYIYMADSKTRRLSPTTLGDDIDSFAALKNLPGYTPANPAYTVANGTTANNAMNTKQTKETQDAATAAGSRDDAVAAEWAFHDFVLGAKDQVRAQYGPNSNEFQALGLKKKSEYKKATKKKTP